MFEKCKKNTKKKSGKSKDFVVCYLLHDILTKQQQQQQHSSPDVVLAWIVDNLKLKSTQLKKLQLQYSLTFINE